MKQGTLIAKRTGKEIYRDGDKTLKVFDADYSKSDVLNEALNQARVEETNLPIPKVIAVTKVEDKWTIVSDYIEGDTLADLMEQHPERFLEYLELFVSLQCKVHKKKSPLLNNLIDKMNRKISEAELDAVTRYDLHSRLAGMPRRSKVCHGDFNPSNIIITPDGAPFILDWSHATQGNAAADAARSYLLFHLNDQKEYAEQYLDLFCHKCRIDKRRVQEWLPIVAASQSVKQKPQEREFLLSWLDVVDYE